MFATRRPTLRKVQWGCRSYPVHLTSPLYSPLCADVLVPHGIFSLRSTTVHCALLPWWRGVGLHMDSGPAGFASPLASLPISDRPSIPRAATPPGFQLRSTILAHLGLPRWLHICLPFQLPSLTAVFSWLFPLVVPNVSIEPGIPGQQWNPHHWWCRDSVWCFPYH